MAGLIAGRGASGALVAPAATWVAFVAAVCLAVRQPPDPGQVALGAAVGAILIFAGFAAASRCRPLSPRAAARRVAAGASATGAGAALGVVLVAAMAAIARVQPGIRARFAGRLSEPAWRPWALGFESSVIEEVVFRLFLMSVACWIAARVVRGRRAAEVVALAFSSLAFGAAHLPAWLAAAPAGAALIACVLLLNGIGGALFGWVFWRWGLPYAILCHLAGDVVVQTAAPRLLG